MDALFCVIVLAPPVLGLSTCQRLRVRAADIFFEEITFCGITVVIQPEVPRIPSGWSANRKLGVENGVHINCKSAALASRMRDTLL